MVVHYRQNEFGDLQTEPLAHGGLTAAGRELVRAMNRVSDEHARSVADCGGMIGVDHVAIGTDMDANFKPVMTDYDGFAALEIELDRRHGQCVSARFGAILTATRLVPGLSKPDPSE